MTELEKDRLIARYQDTIERLQSQLTETRDQLEKVKGLDEYAEWERAEMWRDKANELGNQLEKEREVGDALGADLWEARKAALSLRNQLEKAKAEK